MFLHYPPTCILDERSSFTDMAEEYGAEKVIYAHCYGDSRFYTIYCVKCDILFLVRKRAHG